METRNYKVKIFNGDILDFTVNFGYHTYQSLPRIEAFNEKYDLKFVLQKNSDNESPNERIRIAYAIQNDSVSVNISERSPNMMDFIFRYGIECGRTLSIKKTAELVNPLGLHYAVRDVEFACLKRKYDELLEKVSN